MRYWIQAISQYFLTFLVTNWVWIDIIRTIGMKTRGNLNNVQIEKEVMQNLPIEGQTRTNSLGMQFVRIELGSFMMGSENASLGNPIFYVS